MFKWPEYDMDFGWDWDWFVWQWPDDEAGHVEICGISGDLWLGENTATDDTITGKNEPATLCDLSTSAPVHLES